LWQTCKAKGANFTREYCDRFSRRPGELSAFDTARPTAGSGGGARGADSGSSDQPGAELGFGIEEI